jgi:DNA polymerase-1
MSHGPTVLCDFLNTFIRNFVVSPYMNSNGERMGGCTGTVISVRKMLNDFKAGNILMVHDGEGGSQRRKAIFSDYKAGRSVRVNRNDDDMAVDPEEQLANMRMQIGVTKEYLGLLGIPQVRADSVEADDLIAYVAANINQPGGTIIVTTDQDMLQLIREAGGGCSSEDHTNGCTERCTPRVSEVRVYSPIKKVMYDRKRFISDYGILPENLRLAKSLTGDASDNIPGIRGFGIKTVARSFPYLAERFATPQDILETALTLKGTLGKRLQEEKEKFLKNLTLVDLSDPMLSATAARQAREALRDDDLRCQEVNFRIRILRDGVTFAGDVISPFRDFQLRRKRLLAELSAHTEPVIEEDENV